MAENNPQFEDLFNYIKFNDDGLVPAIAQEEGTGRVLMMAWMSRESIEQTLIKKQVCYFSRSREALWEKGATSGHVQSLKEFRVDCDGDTVLLTIHQEGAACHTGRKDCFYYSWKDGKLDINQDPIVDMS